MGATVGPVDTERFASDLKGLWERFNSLDPEAIMAASGTNSNSNSNRDGLNDKAEQEATGFLLDLVSVSEANSLKLPRGKFFFFFSRGRRRLSDRISRAAHDLRQDKTKQTQTLRCRQI